MSKNINNTSRISTLEQNIENVTQSVITDHGGLSGLTDDDHSQYHNDTRGDARYYTQTQLDAGELDDRYYTETESDANFVQVDGSNNMTSDLDLNSNKITNLATPTVNGDGAEYTWVNSITNHINFHYSNVTTSTNAVMPRTQTSGWPTRYYSRNDIKLDGATVYFDSEASLWTSGTMNIHFYKGSGTANSGTLLHTLAVTPASLNLLNDGEEDDNTTAWNEWVVDLSSGLDDEISAGEHLSVRVDATSTTGPAGIEMMLELHYIRQ